MSLAIGSLSVASLGTCSCGMCAACSAPPVMRASSAPVAEADTSSSSRADSFTWSGDVSPVDDATDPSAATDDTTTTAASSADSSTHQRDEKSSADSPGKLTADEQQMVTELQARDREVRAHEAAHQAAGGGNVGGASYSYQQGPDGRQYAIGGEVPVDMSTSGGSSPEAVIAKMAQVQAAAMAPADPSPQDFAVAAAAAAIAAAARQQQNAAKASESANAAKKLDPSDQATGPRQDERSSASQTTTIEAGKVDDSSPSPTSRAAPPTESVMGGAKDDRPAVERPASEPKVPRAVGAYPASAGLVGTGTGSVVDQRA
jgi:SprA-related family